MPFTVGSADWSSLIHAGEYVAISLTNLQETYAALPNSLSEMKYWAPYARIGYSIHLYRALKEIPKP